MRTRRSHRLCTSKTLYKYIKNKTSTEILLLSLKYWVDNMDSQTELVLKYNCFIKKLHEI